MTTARTAARLVAEYGSEAVLKTLTPLVSEERLLKLERVTRARRADVTLLLDRFYDPHNNAAVLRSAEAFGLLEVHAVPGKRGAELSVGVVQGVDKWIDFRVHASADEACARLSEGGFALIGADVRGEPPETLTLPGRIAVVMGAEKEGLADEVRARCAALVSIPMAGLVESFNVSVAAALLLQRFLAARAAEPLPEADRRALLARYLVLSVRSPEIVLRATLARG